MKREVEEQLLLVESGTKVGNGNDSGPGDGEATYVLIFSVFIAVCGSFICGCAVGGYSSPVQSAIISDLGLSTAEIFPIRVNGAAGTLATVVSFSSAWITSFAFNIMMEWSSSGTFFIYGGINVISLIFVAKLVPETKGRTLEQIQESITSFSY